MKIILASNSPRRKELLSAEGFCFEVKVSDYEETAFSLDPVKTATTFSIGKAQSTFNSLSVKEDVVVLGSDTVVFLDGKILGKPKDEEEARQMLASLSGKTHSVVSGYALVHSGEIISGYDKTEVTFNVLTEDMIDEYIESGLYKGKAGGYGIQDGYNLVKSYEGSLNNVIGLPTEKITPVLKKLLKIRLCPKP